MLWRRPYSAPGFLGEAVFQRLSGVASTAVDYRGGSVENPTDRQVCTDTTGYAEVVGVRYDPAVISYEGLLDVFWVIHDPTALNRQGPNVGSRRRSVILRTTPPSRPRR